MTDEQEQARGALDIEISIQLLDVLETNLSGLPETQQFASGTTAATADLIRKQVFEMMNAMNEDARKELH